jgi:hypothetical protein
MRKVLLVVLAGILSTSLLAQTDSAAKRTVKPVAGAKGGDHFLIQVGSLSWSDKPDSIKTKGLSRTFNMYFLFDFPFKTNPKFSVAIGPGIATDNMFFDETNVGIAANTSSVVFDNVSDTNHFKKYKLTTAYLEAPVELRFTADPDNNKKSIKIAVGAKVGTLLTAVVKGKELQNSADRTINNYTMKEKSKRFLNSNRLSLTGRVGYGPFSLFASYGITPVFKEGLGPQVKPLTIGLTISGL